MTESYKYFYVYVVHAGKNTGRRQKMNGNKIAVSLGAVFSQDLDDKSFSSLYSKADSVMYLCKDNKEHCSMAFYEVH